MNKPQIIIKNDTNFEKTILIVGVFHGDEPQGEFFINEFLCSGKVLKDGKTDYSLSRGLTFQIPVKTITVWI